MSHYNSSSSAGSWQNQKSNNSNNNNNTGASSSSSTSLFNQLNQHDLLSSQSNQTSTNTALTGLYNNTAAASLLAQFSALNQVNLSSLAANLPALVALQQQQQPATATTSGYQWHSQNRLAQQTSASTGSSSSSLANNQSYLLGPGGTMSNSTSSSSSSSAPNQTNNYSSSNLKSSGSTNSTSLSKSNNSYDPRTLMSKPQSNGGGNANQSNNNKSSSSRYDSRDRSNNSNNRYSSASSASNNTTSSSSTPINNNSLPALTANPLLAQALLNQLAAQTNTANTNNTALVAALAAANAAVVSQQQQIQNNLQSHSKTPGSGNRGRRSRTRSRTRSRSRSRSSFNGRNNASRSSNRPTQDTRSVVRRSTRSKSPVVSALKRLSYSGGGQSAVKHSSQVKDVVREPSKETSVKDGRDGREGKDSKGATSHNHAVSHSHSTSSARYSIKLPRYSLDSMANNVTSLKYRYSSLYIPSDFTNAKNTWVNSLPLNRPLKFNSRCLFHIMSKDAYSIGKNTAVYDPPDSDHKWTVKVMLLSMPNVDELYKRSCSFAEDNQKDNRYEHPSKVIQFLVGNKGKHELMALGGPWSPSLDGPNPATNTQTLINTATRTVKALTGIDLSPCTQWFRFLDIQYNRNEDYKSTIIRNNINTTNTNTGPPSPSLHGEQIEDREELNLNDDKDVETTVLFLPNVWSLMPTSIEYQKVVDGYKNLIENPPQWLLEEQQQQQADEATQPKEEDVSDGQEVPITITTTTTPCSSPANSPTKSLKVNSELSENPAPITIDSLIQSASQHEASHYSKIDLKKIKVDELRSELLARGLDTKGLKPQLISRLKEALEAEKAQDGVESLNESKENTTNADDSTQNSINLSLNADDDQMQIDIVLAKNEENLAEEPITEHKPDLLPPPPVPLVQPVSKLSKQEKERIYKLPSNPHIIVHPSTTAKQNKFDCQLISLSHLLDYRRDDNKECSFEVFLFAECFNEMLIRDNGFLIFKHLLSIKEEDTTVSNINKRKLADEETSETKKAKPNDADSNGTQSKEDKSVVAASQSSSNQSAKPKPKTVFADLLLSFTYLDTNRTNHLYEKDLEDLFLLIGLNLSRSKAKSLSKKVSIRDGLLSYRSLTDKSSVSIPNQVFYKLPSDDDIVNSAFSFDLYMKRSVLIKDQERDNANQIGIIEINGTSIDVLNTIKKLEKSELNLNKLDLKYKDSLEEIDRLKASNKSSDRQRQKIQDELNELKKKLRDQQRSNKDIDERYLRLKDCVYRTKSQLNRVLDDISDTTKRNQPPSSSKSSSSINNSVASDALNKSTSEKSSKTQEKVDVAEKTSDSTEDGAEGGQANEDEGQENELDQEQGSNDIKEENSNENDNNDNNEDNEGLDGDEPVGDETEIKENQMED